MQVRSALVDWIVQRRGVRRWTKAARRAPDMPLRELRHERSNARKLLYSLNEMLAVAENRLALPMIGSHAFPKPHGTDWAWRPSLWCLPLPNPGMSSAMSKSKLGDELILFHDCAHSELTLRQIRNQREADLAPYGLRMDVFNFDGSFLSVVLDLPHGAVDGLKKNHLVRLNTIVEMEKPLEIFARLNIKHGPNTEQIVRELPLHEDDIVVEFDLAYSNLNEKRIERAWLDLIFENPQMSQVTLRDVTLSRRQRADF
ncbi:hypothetical protein G5B38_14510 [Pseudohalocynthiibacter aestuariivivens]|uniref:DUF6478 family protein n=1 Tax=Roseovarius pelagicus TaxID=2980108 RepID=A0ABY6DFB4_9RHOB|nr:MULTISPECIES: DUF6478 family protein [Rhodobacterales]QIE46638.1 hypothetical protein G5B38_14510 [Pseudohalocynthiibacter aestuariivivens]UXX84831.1 DUF6478 family protein [Roseovarius pelagicus]